MLQMNGGSPEGAGGGGGGREGLMLKRGIKRDAYDSNLSSDFERFEKRLRMLSLRSSNPNRNDKDSQLYTPIPAGPSTNDHSPSHEDNEHMQVEDTPSRVYIHDLDAELADIDSSSATAAAQERLIFLPDIGKHFTRLPQQVLTGGGLGGDDDGHRELVLYDIPKSLTVDESHDSVRKAIIESRQRAREKAVAEDARRAHAHTGSGSGGLGKSLHVVHAFSAGTPARAEVSTHAHEEEDPDAMDLG